MDNTVVNYAVEIGDSLWSLIYTNLEKSFSDSTKEYECSIYSIAGIYEENNAKFVIVRHREENTFYKITFNYSEEGFEFTSEPALVEATFIEVNASNISQESVTEYEETRYAKKDDEEKKEDKAEEEPKEEEEKTEDPKEEDKPEDSDEEDEDDEKKKKEKTSYSLEEYNELVEKYNALVESNNELQTSYSNLQAENETLRQFKVETETVAKENLIAEFTMLSDEDKKDVVENITSYTLDEIEAKLAVICRRKKISFAVNTDIELNDASTTFSLNNADNDVDSGKPSWLRAVDRNIKKNNN